MVRLAFRGAVGLLAAALATACLGGQTGQPTSLDCGATSLAPTAAWGGTTVQAAAEGFEGTHGAGLEWRVEARSSMVQTPVELVDNVQLTITYDNAKADRSCSNQVSVPVSVTVTTSDSGLAEGGPGTLILEPEAQGFSGSLHFENARVRLDALLEETALALPAQGSFDALDPVLPGASAVFVERQP